MTHNSIMIQGTGSHVGKSILVCALCRILRQDGYNVAPFKSQNMALNSFVTKDGKEIGRAQATQAEAAGIEPMAEMNPILLKPTSNQGSQVVIMGRPVGNMSAKEYYQQKNKFIPVIRESYETLKNKFDIIVIEGAGSPAEINLKDNDIVNMGMAQMASAPVLLTTDIDRGGAFAWIVGTLELLSANEKKKVKGIIFNKFRGDKTILKPGLDMLENRTQKPVIGVIPYMHNLSIDDEDSVSLEYFHDKGTNKHESNCIDIVIIKLPRISNYTDFTVLEQESGVRLRFIDRVYDIGTPDLLIIPGSKNTIADMEFLKEKGFFEEIISQSGKDAMIVGICGGYQMLGKQINDPFHVESNRDSIHGLGLLNTVTTFAKEKNTYQVRAHLVDQKNLPQINDEELRGYEIHMGETTYNGDNSVKPFAKITERAEKKVEISDGCVSENGKVMGTYIHGIFDNNGFRTKLLNHLRLKKGIMPTNETSGADIYFLKESKYNELANTARMNIDMNAVYGIMNRNFPS